MTRNRQRDIKNQFSDARTVGLATLVSYTGVLTFLANAGKSQQIPTKMDLPFIQSVPGIRNLFLSLSAVAPAMPGANDEEWNPLSQRPHSPLAPAVGEELGAEVTALKEAIDAFTTLSHEMMHVALWEPFFVGRWRPKSRARFQEFSLRAEGFCFFFTDIVVSGAVRAVLPDGEFALDRLTPSNARFHPVRAFQALKIDDPEAILAVYLDGFSGGQTCLWRPRGADHFAAALASEVYDFYEKSLPYLGGLYTALGAFGGLTEYYRRFCTIPGLPTFLNDLAMPDEDGKNYFVDFFQHGLKKLEQLAPTAIQSIRWRRMLQMRAYYAQQMRWLLREGMVVGKALRPSLLQHLAGQVESYLDGLGALLSHLGQSPDDSPLSALEGLDATYNKKVRARLAAHDAWAAERWLIAPRRAGGRINVVEKVQGKDRAIRAQLVQTAAFLVDELSQNLAGTNAATEQAELLAQINRVASLGAAGEAGKPLQARTAMSRLQAEMKRPSLLGLWSVPLTGFDPVGNRYRELLFSYQ